MSGMTIEKVIELLRKSKSILHKDNYVYYDNAIAYLETLDKGCEHCKYNEYSSNYTTKEASE